jgi:hypothetical protein
MKQISLLFSIFVLLCFPILTLGQGYTLTVSEHAVDIIDGHTTYRLYIDMVNPEDKLSAIYGGVGEPLSITTTEGFFNDAFGGTSAGMINPALFGFFPTILADSWFTIGIESQPSGDESAISLVEGDVPLAAHFDASDALSGTDLLIDDETGGAWFSLSDAPNGLPDENLQTLFMQLTIPTGGEICATVNAQIFAMGIGENEIVATVSFCGVGTFEPNTTSVTPGCTDAAACNFNPLATEDDNSCEYTTCLGCTDMEASNYDPSATVDDGSCTFTGCTDMTACNYNAAATESDNSCLFADEGYDCSGNCLADLDGDGVCDADEILGCSDLLACNYNSEATEDDGSCDFCSCSNSGGLPAGPEYTMTIEEHASDLVEGMITYRFYANLINPDDFLSSVFGNSDNPFSLQTSDGFYNSTYGGTSADQINPAFFGFFPDLVADSWVTIGIDSTPVGAEVSISTVESSDQPWVGAFASGSEIDGGNVIMDDETGGAWYVLNTTPNGLPDAENNRVLFMQLTTSGTFSGTCHFQVFVNGIGSDDVRSSFDFDGVGDYNPNAEVNEGNACGCTDAEASNYDDSADYDDGSCDYTVLGCTDVLACNYDESANEDDETCEYPNPGYNCEGCITDSDLDGICDEFEIPGCTDAMACNFDETATDDDGMCTFAQDGYDCLGNCLVDTDNDGVCDDFEIAGCTNMEACNYNAEATDSDDSCVFPEPNYDCNGECLSDVDMDGVCDVFEVAGCQDATACNYNPEATDDDDSCVYAETYYDCDGNCISDQDMDGVCDELEVSGCTDMLACNYNELATDEDGSCSYAEVNYDCNGDCLNDADGDGICDELEIAGCTDPLAENYNDEATDDDGSCYYCDIEVTIDEIVNDVEGAGGSISISISGGNSDYSVVWSGPDGFSSEEEDIVGLGGDYTVTVTDSNGCEFTLDIVMEIVISVAEWTSSPLLLFPNPASEEVFVTCPEYLDVVYVKVFDSSGRIMYQQESQPVNGLIRLNVAQYAIGLYTVSIQSGMNLYTEQLIVQ